MVARKKLSDLVIDFLGRLTTLDGANSSLRVFCRVDLSVHVNEHKRVSLFVNEVERVRRPAYGLIPAPAQSAMSDRAPG